MWQIERLRLRKMKEFAQGQTVWDVSSKAHSRPPPMHFHSGKRVCGQRWAGSSKKPFPPKPKITPTSICHPRLSLWMPSIEIHYNSVTPHDVPGSVYLYTLSPTSCAFTGSFPSSTTCCHLGFSATSGLVSSFTHYCCEQAWGGLCLSYEFLRAFSCSKTFSLISVFRVVLWMAGVTKHPISAK